ncbi:MAG TPA: ATP-binding protein, partial [Cellvibrio sp.]
AMTAFIQTLQFLPATFAIVFWSKGNRRGVIAGLAVGTSVWAIGLLLPMLTGLEFVPLPFNNWAIPVGIEHWSEVTLISISLNTLCFVLISMMTTQTEDEEYSADVCAADELSHPVRQALDVHSAAEFKHRLAKPLGKVTASREVDIALKELSLGIDERRPYALRRLRDQIEGNLSSLMGIHVASEIMDKYIPHVVAESHNTVDINLIESRLSEYRDHLTGMAAELNTLRLYHRKTLEELPMAVCSLGRDMEVLMWNRAMAELTGTPTEDVTGSHLEDIPEPWCSLLIDFSQSNEPHFYRREIELDGRPHWISLHKANIEGTITAGVYDQVMLLEDVTETQLLEQELVHSERLASVGRLAAGVAHEIGNPITGIACLAQNLKYDSTDPAEVLETAEQILSQTDRVGRIVQSLVSFSHAGHASKTEFEAVSLRDCANEAIHLLSLQKDKNQVLFCNDIPKTAIIAGDAQRMIQVFINLLSNARDASPEQGRVMLESNEDEDSVTVSVTDEGHGIPPELIERILEPFFTTKEPGEGTGLGLAMVYSIVEDHSGHMDIISPADTVHNRGASFVITLPRHLDSFMDA